MTKMVPVRWREALGRIEDKVGHFLAQLIPRKKEEHLPETMTADTIPAFMELGGPLLDMYETPDEVVVRVEVPGMKQDEFSVQLVGRRLTIQGEKKVVRKEKGGDGKVISECRYGSFARSVNLPYPVDEKAVKADLKHGVLTLRLPRPVKGPHARFVVPVS